MKGMPGFTSFNPALRLTGLDMVKFELEPCYRNISEEELLKDLKEVAEKLKKKSVAQDEYNRLGKFNPCTLSRRFGSWSQALEKAGLEVLKFMNIPNEQLFENMEIVWKKLDRQPKYDDMRKSLSKYSSGVYEDRFGTWSNALEEFIKYKNNGISQPIENEIQKIENTNKNNTSIISPVVQNISRKPFQIYGEPIYFRGLRHTPLNEQGVVFLFGKVCGELGFQIEAIQTGFPDCKGKYLYDAKKNQWADALIEFEFKAANFKDHGHDPNQCNFIVCWENDWADCPITVIELKKEILKLAAR